MSSVSLLLLYLRSLNDSVKMERELLNLHCSREAKC